MRHPEGGRLSMRFNDLQLHSSDKIEVGDSFSNIHRWGCEEVEMDNTRRRSGMFSGLNSWFLHILSEGSNDRLKSIPLKPDHITEFWAEVKVGLLITSIVVKVGLLITSSVLHDPLVKQSQAFNIYVGRKVPVE